MKVILTSKDIGKCVRAKRKALGLTQTELAMTSSTGIRFISDLENGKETCQVGKVFMVLNTLGLRWSLEDGKEGAK